MISNIKIKNVSTPRVLVNILCHDIKLRYLKNTFNSIQRMDGVFDLRGICFNDQRETLDFFQSKGLSVNSYNRPFKKGHNNDSIIRYYAGMSEVELNQLSWLRNKCLEKAKEYDYLMFIDSDIIIKKEMLEELLKANKQIIGGWYFNRRIPKISTDFEHVNIDEVMNDKVICRIKTMGTGCTLLRKDVFMKERFPEKNIEYGEDWDFYLGLNNKGYKIWCHTMFYCEHLAKFKHKARKYRDDKIKKWNL